MLGDKNITVDSVRMKIIDGKNYIILESNIYNSPVTFSTLQQKIFPYNDLLIFGWWAIWIATLLYLIYTYILKRIF